MYIKNIRMQGFRNYRDEVLEFSPRTNVIYGNNAQGKTNILEAVYLFAQGRSHRAKTDREMISFGSDFARLTMEFADSEREYKAEMRILRNGRKSITINRVPILKLSRLMSYLNAVMFSPEDLDLVKGSPQARRRFTDSSISQLYPSYMASLIEYNKILNQKNSLLKSTKKAGTDGTLDIWNESLAENAAKIMTARSGFVERINGAARRIQSEISGEELFVRYMPNIKVSDISKDTIYGYLTERKEREAEMGTSQYGIQRDDLAIYINDNDSRLFSSQGQQRTAALSMKIAQAEYIKEIKGEYPVLLLDDIMSELDINRRMYLSERIHDKQVLITSTDTDLIGRDTDTKLFHIENGAVVQCI